MYVDSTCMSITCQLHVLWAAFARRNLFACSNSYHLKSCKISIQHSVIILFSLHHNIMLICFKSEVDFKQISTFFFSC